VALLDTESLMEESMHIRCVLAKGCKGPVGATREPQLDPSEVRCLWACGRTSYHAKMSR